MQARWSSPVATSSKVAASVNERLREIWERSVAGSEGRRKQENRLRTAPGAAMTAVPKKRVAMIVMTFILTVVVCVDGWLVAVVLSGKLPKRGLSTCLSERESVKAKVRTEGWLSEKFLYSHKGR